MATVNDPATKPTATASASGRSGDHGEAASAQGAIVVDLGKKRRKQIRRARQGRGKLMDQMQTVLEDLRANGTIAAGAQPVLMVVRQRRRRNSRWFA